MVIVVQEQQKKRKIIFADIDNTLFLNISKQSLEGKWLSEIEFDFPELYLALRSFNQQPNLIEKKFNYYEVIFCISECMLSENVFIYTIKKHSDSQNLLSVHNDTFSNIFKNTGDAYWLIREDIFIDCNEVSVQIMKAPDKNSIIDKKPFELSPVFQSDGRLSSEKQYEVIATAKKDGHNIFEWTHLKFDKTEFIAEVSLTHFKNDETDYFLAIWRDVTAKKHFENSLIESEARFKALAEASPTAIFILQQGRFVYGNPATLILTEYDWFELMNLSFENIINAEHKSILKTLNEITDKSSVLRFELPIISKTQTTKWIDISTSYIHFHNTSSIMVVAYDITLKVTALEELRNSECLYKSLIELAVDGIITGDEQGFIIGVNKKFLEMSGRDEKEIIGKHFSYLFSKEELEKSPLRFDLLKEGLTFICERKLSKKNGEQIYVETHSKRLPNNMYQSIFRDITRRKEEQKAKAEQTRFLETLINNLPGMIYRCKFDKDWTMEFIQGKFFELTGYQPEEFIFNAKYSFNDIIHKQDRQRLWEKWQVIVANKTDFQDEYRIKTKEGQIKWVLGKATPVYDTFGNVVVIEGFISEITTIKNTQITLKKSQQTYKSLAFQNQILSEAALAFGEAGNIQQIEELIVKYYSKLTKSYAVLLMSFERDIRCLKLVQWQIQKDVKKFIDEKLGNTLNSLIIPINEEVSSNILNNMIKKERHIKNISFGAIPDEIVNELQSTFKIKEVIIVAIQWQNILRGTLTMFLQHPCKVSDSILQIYGQLAGFVIAKKIFEIDLQIAKDKAEENNRLKSVFLANISHEIRTPMNAILGFAQLLKKEDISPNQRKKFANIMTDSGNQLLGLIEDLIDLSKIQTGHLKINNSFFSPFRVLSQLYEMYLPKFKSKELIFSLNIEDTFENMFLTSDELRIKQIIINLLENAYKYTNSGIVSFGYTIKDYEMLFFVQDTGMGISEKNKNIIFERFTQLDNQPISAFGGKGLGLSIVKSLANLLGGYVTFTSQLGEGSTFYLHLPLFSPKSVPLANE